MNTLKAATVAMCVLAGTAQAALIDRGGGMIYDTTFNITWLADMNYAHTSGYSAANAGGSGASVVRSAGEMGWDAATAWANGLVYGGFDDWRLPTLNPSDTSCSRHVAVNGYPDQYYNSHCTGGELSHLFVTDLGRMAGSSVPNLSSTVEQIANLRLFVNVESGDYWSGAEYAPNLSAAWLFNTTDGRQDTNLKSNAFWATAVRSGDVAASVPEPQTLALMLAALGAGAVARRRCVHRTPR